MRGAPAWVAHLFRMVNRNELPESPSRSAANRKATIILLVAILLLAPSVALIFLVDPVFAILLAMPGYLLMIVACWFYAEGKGYRGVVGFLGILGLLGYTVLAILPTKSNDKKNDKESPSRPIGSGRTRRPKQYRQVGSTQAPPPRKKPHFDDD